ncbi:hypothetical protein RM545_14565 [Zunongwangia sp. F260]|uniref:Uncharacterized protein n=1 Tax=Autumnicola lenta TaxID=3075593 RepID=A0ABU3CPQ8_9FLAO|nr:hypothetical protein [Zunongwangia sp. F260]MDT0647920.1 hypothetical protein [Zunongwangia sp. F260]
MERSIENIWKKGFEAEEKLSVPVVSNLYERKSTLLIEQIKRTTRKDNFSLIPVGVVIFFILVFMGKVVLGFYVAALITALYFLNKKKLKELETLDVKNSTYDYLLDYRNQVKSIVKFSTWLMGVGFPLVAIPAYWIFFRGSEIMSNFEQLDLALELLIVAGMAVLLFILGILAYRISTAVIYGKLLVRLESTIEDMEELMKA